MASTALGSKWTWSFTVGLGMLACFGPVASDGGLGADAGVVPPGGGGASAVAGATGHMSGPCGAGGESGSSVGGYGGESGSSVGGYDSGGAGGGLPACSVLPEAPGAALLRVPSLLPDGMLGTTVLGMSADGTTVVGAYDQLIVVGQPLLGQVHIAFRWTIERGIEPLETPATQSSDARAANADGSVVVGSLQDPSAIDRRAVVWTSAGLRELELLAGASGSSAVAVNADGSVIVGLQWFREGSLVHNVPVRWTAAGVEMLDNPAQPYGAFAVGASADGSIVAGTQRSPSNAVRWIGSGPMQLLGVAGALESEATAISPDGSILVGWANFPPDGTQAVRWEGDRAELLGFAEGALERTAMAWGVDADGGTIAVTADGQGAVWRRGQGIRRLDALLGSLGEDLASWTLDVPSAVSADGRLIAGTGRCGDGSRGFVVRLPGDDGASADAGP